MKKQIWIEEKYILEEKVMLMVMCFTIPNHLIKHTGKNISQKEESQEEQENTMQKQKKGKQIG